MHKLKRPAEAGRVVSSPPCGEVGRCAASGRRGLRSQGRRRERWSLYNHLRRAFARRPSTAARSPSPL